MAFNLGDIIATIKVNTDGVKSALTNVQNMTKSVEGFTDKANAYMQGSVNASQKLAVGVAAAGAAVVGFGVVSVKAFEDSQNRIAQTNAVLQSTKGIAGVTADAVTKLASALERQTQFSDEDVRSVENLLLTFTSIGKDIFPQATSTVLDMAQALGEDTASASIQLGKALQDPILGVTALRRVGVNFNSAQIEVIKNLVETGRSADAQKLILAELNKEFGGSAKAAGETFAGSLAKLKNQFNNLQEQVGGTIVQALAPFAARLAELVDKAQEAGGLLVVLKKAFEQNKGIILAVAGGIAGALVPAMLAFVASLASTVFYLLPFIAVGAALFYLWDRNRLLFFMLAGAVAGFAIAILVALMPAIIAATTGFAAMAIAVIAATWPFILVGAIVAGLAYLFITHFSQIKKFVLDAFSVLKTGLRVLGQTFGDVFGAIGKTVGDVMSGIGTVVHDVFSFIWGIVQPILMLWWNLNVIVFGAILIVILTVMQAIKSIIMTVWGAIWPYISAVLNFIKDLIVTAFNFYYGIISAVLGAIWGVVSKVGGTILGFLGGLIGGVVEVAKNIVGGLFNGLGTASSGIGKWIHDNIVTPLMNVFNGATKWLYDIGKSIIQGLINGIKDMVGEIGKAAGNISKTVQDKVKNLLGIHSPSRVFMELGRNVALGFANGITAAQNVAADAVSTLANTSLSPIAPAGNVQSLLGGVSSFLSANQAASQTTNSTVHRDTYIYGDIKIDSKNDADYLLQRLDRNSQLEGMGVSTQ